MAEAPRSKLLAGYVPPHQRAWFPWTWHGEEPDNWAGDLVSRARRLALSDFFFFCDEIMRDVDDPHLHELHAEMCHIVQREDECGILVPRYHLKSTLCTVAHALWRMAKNQNTRILLKAATEPVAEGFLNAIKQHILSNKKFKTLFPEVKPGLRENGKSYKVWNTYSIECDRNKIYSEPSIYAVGAKTNLTGMHFDLAIYDDLMAEENAKNEDSINEVIRKFEADIFLMLPRSRRFMVGTRYDDKDLYGHLMDNRDFEFYIRAGNENGKWIWPNPDVVAKIQRDKKNCSPYVYSCQIMNNPIDKDTQEFKSEFKTFWDVHTVRKEMGENAPADDLKLLDAWYRTLEIYLGLDPARSEKEVKRNSSIAMISVGVDTRGREHLLERIKLKGIGPTMLVEKWLAFIVKWSKYPVRLYGQEAQGGDNHLVEPTLKGLKAAKLPLS
ncbi:MAG: hypothetical protein NUV42_02955, partial [Candidatus Yonathbacteria bacterium]|nr:hypothetical protein [Candidatus Yonathbacteria bacterium]